MKKVCVIAGVGPGNGASLSRRFSAEGYTVVMLARNQDYLDSLSREIPESIPMVCDVREPDAIKAVFSQIHDQAGSVDTLVYNAGTAFASAKAAQRSLAQSMARDLGPKGIHVGYLIIDGIIDLERTRTRMPDKADDYFMKPDAIANSVFALTQQDRSAWTFELDLRPFGERW